MKCEYCGGNLSLENEYCPFCGQPNRHAKQHIRDMKHFRGEFENTKKYVHDKTAGYTEVTVRAVIIAVLAVLVIGSFALGAKAWDITWSLNKNRAARRYDEYSAILDEYLENEDYLAFDAFCEGKSLRGYEDAYREKYGGSITLCARYADAYYALYDFAGSGAEGADYIAEWAGDTLDSFYRCYFNEDFNFTEGKEEPEEFRRAADVMKRNIELILVTYCGFTEEEAAAMPGMSKLRRGVLLEEKLEGERRNGQ